ncbi:MAG TPA: hypothetical protein VL595_21455 [Pseudonocardia sp.]|nr:hypothetical protein [Pseudonocardia sp.]
MLRAERRRRVDVVVAVLLVAAVAVGAALLAVYSPAANTTSVTAAGPIPAVPDAPDDVPGHLTELWHAPSAATPGPLAVGPVVVTGDQDDGTSRNGDQARAGHDGGIVTGRDPFTGRALWSYRRNLPLCTVGSGWGNALAVYRRGDYCSEITALTATTGARGPQRNSDTHPPTRLFGVGDLVAATGPGYLEVWRSDLVRTVMYGATRADAQPDRQPHRDCRHVSAAGAEDRLAVLERCPGEPTDRLTMLRPDGKEPDRPEVDFSVSLPAAGTRLVAVSVDRVAVLLPNPTRISVRDSQGNEITSYPIDLPPTDLAGDPPDGTVATSDGLREQLWWSGSRTVALEASELRPEWTVPAALGPGTLWAGRLLVPVPAGLAVLDVETGATLRTLPLDRGGWHGPVRLSSIGPVLLEQRGPTVVALR